jgi:hypothetical protein
MIRIAAKILQRAARINHIVAKYRTRRRLTLKSWLTQKTKREVAAHFAFDRKDSPY